MIVSTREATDGHELLVLIADQVIKLITNDRC